MLGYLAKGILQVVKGLVLDQGRSLRLGLIKLVDVILNNYFLGSKLLGPLSWGEDREPGISIFPIQPIFLSIPRANIHCRLTLMKS